MGSTEDAPLGRQPDWESADISAQSTVERISTVEPEATAGRGRFGMGTACYGSMKAHSLND